MASTGKDYQEEIETLTAQEAALRARTVQLQTEQEQAKKMLAQVEEARRSKIFEALDSIKKRYFHRLLGGRGGKVLAPRVSGVEETTLGKGTTIPKNRQKDPKRNRDPADPEELLVRPDPVRHDGERVLLRGHRAEAPGGRGGAARGAQGDPRRVPGAPPGRDPPRAG